MIYPQLLKADFAKLPAVLREFHSACGERHAEGKVAVRLENPSLARLVGFPPAGDDIPARLDVIAGENREVWIRRFGDTIRRSTQWIKDDVLVETAGPLRVYFRVVACGDGMRFESLGTRLCGIPLPLRIEATAHGSGSAWEFEVRIQHVGSYRGVMEPVQ